MQTWQVGELEILRVPDPAFELVLPQDEATRAVLERSAWLQPHFVTDDWSLRVGSTATVVRSPESVVLIDPFLVFDDPAKHAPRLHALREAGIDAHDVDVVVNSHVDGMGINLLADGSPTFPEARYLVPREELEALRSGAHPGAGSADALLALWDSGRIEASEPSTPVAPGLHLEDAPGHNPGQHVVWADDAGHRAVVVGHLFLHPAQIANPEVDNGDLDPILLAATRRALLERCAMSDAVLIGPLFADPGGGTISRDGDSWRLDV